jgi:hypothetical protein
VKLHNAELRGLYSSQISFDKTKENETGGICGTYVEDEKWF